MKLNSIRCEAVDVKTESGICIGVAKTKKGEVSLIDGRTPENGGMCSNAFCSLANAAFIMMVMEKMPGETDGHIDRICPHGVVTFRLSRSDVEKKKPFTKK